MSEPAKYAPQYGGYCAGEVAGGSVTINIDPEAFRIIDGKDRGKLVPLTVRADPADEKRWKLSFGDYGRLSLRSSSGALILDRLELFKSKSYVVYEPALSVLPAEIDAVGLVRETEYRMYSVETGRLKRAGRVTHSIKRISPSQFSTPAGLIDGYIPWLTDPTLVKLSVVVAHVWTQFPFAAVLLMAALVAIDPEQYEAARIDGASAWQRFRHVTLPQIKAMLVVLLVYATLVAFTSYDLVYAMTGGGPGTATTLLSFQIWRESFSMYNFGSGAAVAFITVLISLAFILAIVKALPSDLFGED